MIPRLWCLPVILPVILILSCTEKNTTVVNSPVPLTVDGEVYIWRCGVYDYYNNPYNEDLRFAARTEGDSAEVTFVRLNGLYSSFFTDDSSSFERILDKGAYIIVIESGWTDPDTIHNVYLDNDTTFRIDLVFDYLHPTYLSMDFAYYNGDSLGADAEWDYIRIANGYLQSLDISGFDPPQELLDVREVSNMYGGGIYVNWRISIRRPPNHIGDVLREAKIMLAEQPDKFPDGFYIYPYYSYFCLD